jgi:hypothetical protein
MLEIQEVYYFVWSSKVKISISFSRLKVRFFGHIFEATRERKLKLKCPNS